MGPLGTPVEPKLRGWFEQWRGPNEFYQAAKAGVRLSFCTGKSVPNYLSDAFVAGEFARIWRDARGSCKVRLVPEGEEFPDFQFKAKDVCLDLEITMAPEKDKRMFDEWRKLRAKTEQGQVVLVTRTIEMRQESAREAIPRAVKKKVSKHYTPPPSLLVYTDDGRGLTARELALLTKPWKDSFPAIYLLCGMDVVEAWPELHVLKGHTEP